MHGGIGGFCEVTSTIRLIGFNGDVQVKCEECGIIFVNDRPLRPRRFCSKKCTGANRTRRVIEQVASLIRSTGDECVLWIGQTKPNGLTVGMPRPDGYPGNMFVLHKCDVRNCFNPKHLFLGTNDDNMKDMASKDRSCRGYERSMRTRLIRGYKVKKIINNASVRLIRLRVLAGESRASIAREYGVSSPVVSYICSRKTWKHVL